MPDADPNLMTIFAEALERTDPAARAAYLDAPVGTMPRSASGSRRCSPPTRGRAVPGARLLPHVRNHRTRNRGRLPASMFQKRARHRNW